MFHALLAQVHAPEELVGQTPLHRLRQFREFVHHHESSQHGGVDLAHAVGRPQHRYLVLLEQARDPRLGEFAVLGHRSPEIALATGEDVFRFVQQDGRIPLAAQRVQAEQQRGQALLRRQAAAIGAGIAHLVQAQARARGDLSRQFGLAGAGRAIEHQVGAGHGSLGSRLQQGRRQLLDGGQMLGVGVVQFRRQREHQERFEEVLGRRVFLGKALGEDAETRRQQKADIAATVTRIDQADARQYSIATYQPGDLALVAAQVQAQDALDLMALAQLELIECVFELVAELGQDDQFDQSATGFAKPEGFGHVTGIGQCGNRRGRTGRRPFEGGLAQGATQAGVGVQLAEDFGAHGLHAVGVDKALPARTESRRCVGTYFIVLVFSIVFEAVGCAPGGGAAQGQLEGGNEFGGPDEKAPAGDEGAFDEVVGFGEAA